ncbi:hypothetical protein GGX14DRAFT_565454 [Mycena pura]|uniref:Uncharacterized protein n=1 Tax=Mycena pura TaxID=153505 RepID=A0AAD6VIU6_9AGAR|nr:hypothetical protein GGX14DRAFT_565454 [Mycena pura]
MCDVEHAATLALLTGKTSTRIQQRLLREGALERLNFEAIPRGYSVAIVGVLLGPPCEFLSVFLSCSALPAVVNDDTAAWCIMTQRSYAEVCRDAEKKLDNALHVILGGTGPPCTMALDQHVEYITTLFPRREVVCLPIAGGLSAQVAQGGVHSRRLGVRPVRLQTTPITGLLAFRSGCARLTKLPIQFWKKRRAAAGAAARAAAGSSYWSATAAGYGIEDRRGGTGLRAAAAAGAAVTGGSGGSGLRNGSCSGMGTAAMLTGVATRAGCGSGGLVKGYGGASGGGGIRERRRVAAAGAAAFTEPNVLKLPWTALAMVVSGYLLC